MPGLTPADAVAALHGAEAQERSLRALSRLLVDGGHDLRTGPNSEPFTLVRLVYALHDLGYTQVVRPACANCGAYSANLICRNAARERICSRCYQQPVGRCDRCGRDRPVVRRGGPAQHALCNGCYQGPIMVCTRCGQRGDYRSS